MLIEQGFEPASDTLVQGKRADRHQLPNCCHLELENSDSDAGHKVRNFSTGNDTVEHQYPDHTCWRSSINYRAVILL